MNTKDKAISGNASTERALDLALEALESYKSFIEDAHIIEGQWHWIDGAYQAITAIKQARSASEEPVYHLRQFGDVTKEQLDRYMATGDINPQPAPVQEPVETADTLFRQFMSEANKAGVVTHWPTLPAAQRPVAEPHKWVHATEWRGLTDEEIGDALFVWELTEEWPTFAYAARAIEAKLKEKNT